MPLPKVAFEECMEEHHGIILSHRLHTRNDNYSVHVKLPDCNDVFIYTNISRQRLQPFMSEPVSMVPREPERPSHHASKKKEGEESGGKRKRTRRAATNTEGKEKPAKRGKTTTATASSSVSAAAPSALPPAAEVHAPAPTTNLFLPLPPTLASDTSATAPTYGTDFESAIRNGARIIHVKECVTYGVYIRFPPPAVGVQGRVVHCWNISQDRLDASRASIRLSPTFTPPSPPKSHAPTTHRPPNPALEDCIAAGGTIVGLTPHVFYSVQVRWPGGRVEGFSRVAVDKYVRYAHMRAGQPSAGITTNAGSLPIFANVPRIVPLIPQAGTATPVAFPQLRGGQAGSLAQTRVLPNPVGQLVGFPLSSRGVGVQGQGQRTLVGPHVSVSLLPGGYQMQQPQQQTVGVSSPLGRWGGQDPFRIGGGGGGLNSNVPVQQQQHSNPVSNQLGFTSTSGPMGDYTRRDGGGIPSMQTMHNMQSEPAAGRLPWPVPYAGVYRGGETSDGGGGGGAWRPGTAGMRPDVRVAKREYEYEYEHGQAGFGEYDTPERKIPSGGAYFPTTPTEYLTPIFTHSQQQQQQQSSTVYSQTPPASFFKTEHGDSSPSYASQTTHSSPMYSDLTPKQYLNPSQQPSYETYSPTPPARHLNPTPQRAYSPTPVGPSGAGGTATTGINPIAPFASRPATPGGSVQTRFSVAVPVFDGREVGGGEHAYASGHDTHHVGAYTFPAWSALRDGDGGDGVYGFPNSAVRGEREGDEEDAGGGEGERGRPVSQRSGTPTPGAAYEYSQEIHDHHHQHQHQHQRADSQPYSQLQSQSQSQPYHPFSEYSQQSHSHHSHSQDIPGCGGVGGGGGGGSSSLCSSQNGESKESQRIRDRDVEGGVDAWMSGVRSLNEVDERIDEGDGRPGGNQWGDAMGGGGGGGGGGMTEEDLVRDWRIRRQG
ncbi:uncharacterized protein EV422DRAFT_535249 [Fimicolochytrium jonesii]|uniref:uncharacterized protein n=1 Tax=Fimicolochytrium jonesii TaxID=1396493 RepID=UPI0022FF0305|nr:uncharacterized protein EV422DRAFT_535249 [Fimicolochytrium jonesii]KAI8819140.1 hypothetical protein EV422DRAFT_535249 [Fimicolochytrium jonesii]